MFDTKSWFADLIICKYGSSKLVHIWYLYINLSRSCDVIVLSFLCLFVCLFVCSFLCSPGFSSLWPAFMLNVHINALYTESVEEKNMQLELIQFR